MAPVAMAQSIILRLGPDFPGVNIRKPSWPGDHCNAAVDFKVDFKEQRVTVSS
jgi:hypothetical protein